MVGWIAGEEIPGNLDRAILENKKVAKDSKPPPVIMVRIPERDIRREISEMATDVQAVTAHTGPAAIVRVLDELYEPDTRLVRVFQKVVREPWKTVRGRTPVRSRQR